MVYSGYSRSTQRRVRNTSKVAGIILFGVIAVAVVVMVVPAILSYFMGQLNAQWPIVPALDWWGSLSLIVVLVVLGAAFRVSASVEVNR